MFRETRHLSPELSGDGIPRDGGHQDPQPGRGALGPRHTPLLARPSQPMTVILMNVYLIFLV